jgi:hypothetical protein
MMHSENSDTLERLLLHNTMPASDLEAGLAVEQRHAASAQQVLNVVGTVLERADDTLDHLEANSDLLPTAIVRKCQELADVVGHVAQQLEQHSSTEADQRQLAQAYLQDAAAAAAESTTTTNTAVANTNALWSSSQVSEDDVMAALQGATSFLRDVEAAFREIGRTEADDISDAALTLARLFLLSLQSVHSTLTPEDILLASQQQHAAKSTSRSTTVTIEELSMDNPNTNTNCHNSPKHQEQETKEQQRRRKHQQGLRLLWPPLGPHVTHALDWGTHAASDHPVVAVALGLTLWPAAVCTAVVGGSLVVADAVIQDVYGHFQEGPIVRNLEQGAAQAYQAGKLGVLCSLLVGKQTLRVVGRQVDRHGGVGHIASDVAGMAVHHALHPIETIGMAWDGISWGVGMLTDTLQQVLEHQQEDQQVVRDLQY